MSQIGKYVYDKECSGRITSWVVIDIAILKSESHRCTIDQFHLCDFQLHL